MLVVKLHEKKGNKTILIKSFVGVQGVVFQKNPLAAGGKKN
jgi:hypothetical protein